MPRASNLRECHCQGNGSREGQRISLDTTARSPPHRPGSLLETTVVISLYRYRCCRRIGTWPVYTRTTSQYRSEKSRLFRHCSINGALFLPSSRAFRRVSAACSRALARSLRCMSNAIRWRM